MALTTVVTCSVHFVILTVSHRAEFAGQSWLPSVLSFRWLSVTYALDILAWDVFFAVAVLSAAAVFAGGRLARSIRLLLIISGVLALAGIAGRDPRRRPCPQHRHRRLRRRLPRRSAAAGDPVPPSRHSPSRDRRTAIS